MGCRKEVGPYGSWGRKLVHGLIDHPVSLGRRRGKNKRKSGQAISNGAQKNAPKNAADCGETAPSADAAIEPASFGPRGMADRFVKSPFSLP